MPENKAQVNFLEDFTRRQIDTPPQDEGKVKRIPTWMKVSLIFIISMGVFFSGILFSSSSSLNSSPGGLPKIGISQVWTAFKGYVLGHDGDLEGQKDDRINILLTGIGGLGHDGPFLTDTMIVASIKPSTGQVAMISIPRDLYVPIPNYGWNKINHANSFGQTDMDGRGGELASSTVSQILNIPIQYYIRIDFSGFEKIVDDLGGIEVDVERSFTDQEYPAPDFEYQVVSFGAGQQTMTGDQALKFVRSRHGNNGEGSDFARSARQQKVIMAIKDKALSLSTLANPTKINKMLKNLDNSIANNLNADEIIYLSKFTEEFTGDDIISFSFSSAPDGFLTSDFTSGGAYILRPTSGNFNQMANLANNIFNQVELIEDTPSETNRQESTTTIPRSTQEELEPQEEPEEGIDQETTPRKITISVLNGTKINGLAGSAAAELKIMGLEIVDIANSPKQDYEISVLYRLNANEELTPAIKNIRDSYQVNVTDEIPQYLEGYTSQNVDFVLVLGPDNS